MELREIPPFRRKIPTTPSPVGTDTGVAKLPSVTSPVAPPDPRPPVLLRRSVIDSSPPSPSLPVIDGLDAKTGNKELDTTASIHHVEVSSPPLVVNHSNEEIPSSPIPNLKGSWTVPLHHGSASRQPVSTQGLTDTMEQWPSLSASMGVKLPVPSGAHPENRSRLKTQVTFSSGTKEDVSLKAFSKEYPWAARMDQSKRNLRRVTKPDYLNDGTPLVNIPSHVLLEGIENPKEFIIGQFSRCVAPPGGLIHAVMGKIWGRSCRIFTKKVSESSYLFHVPDEATRRWILQRGLWHVDDYLMFVSPWSPVANIEVPEITTIPAWLTLKNIPNQLYSIKGINWIASGIGEPMLTNRPWLDPTQMGEAKVLVEVKLDKPFPQKVALKESSGKITMVDVVYSWIPTKCSKCGHLGHKASRCLGLGLENPGSVCGSLNSSPPKATNDNEADKELATSDDIIAAKMKGFQHTSVESFVLPTKANELTSESGSQFETAMADFPLQPIEEITDVDAVDNQADKTELVSGTTSVPTESAMKVASTITKDCANTSSTRTVLLPTNTASFRKASSSNKFAVLDLASDRVISDDSSSDDSDDSEESDEDLILNLKTPHTDKSSQDMPVQVSTKEIVNGQSGIGRGRGRGRRGRGYGYRGRRGGFG